METRLVKKRDLNCTYGGKNSIITPMNENYVHPIGGIRERHKSLLDQCQYLSNCSPTPPIT